MGRLELDWEGYLFISLGFEEFRSSLFGWVGGSFGGGTEFVVDAEADRWDKESHEHDNGHAYESDLSERVHGWVFGKDEYAYSHEHYRC